MGFDDAHGVAPRAGPAGSKRGRHSITSAASVRHVAYDYSDAATLLEKIFRAEVDAVLDEKGMPNDEAQSRSASLRSTPTRRALLRSRAVNSRPRGIVPRFAFRSTESLPRVLAERIGPSLTTIVQQQPSSLEELGELTGRAPSNLSRTLKSHRAIRPCHSPSRRAGAYTAGSALSGDPA